MKATDEKLAAELRARGYRAIAEALEQELRRRELPENPSPMERIRYGVAQVDDPFRVCPLLACRTTRV
jgi:hypothetical protein